MSTSCFQGSRGFTPTDLAGDLKTSIAHYHHRDSSSHNRCALPKGDRAPLRVPLRRNPIQYDLRVEVATWRIGLDLKLLAGRETVHSFPPVVGRVVEHVYFAFDVDRVEVPAGTVTGLDQADI